MHYRNGREAVAGDKVFDIVTRKVGVIYDLSPGATSCNAKLLTEEPYQYVSVGECVHIDDVIVMFPDRSKAGDEQGGPKTDTENWQDRAKCAEAEIERLAAENADFRTKLDVLHKQYWEMEAQLSRATGKKESCLFCGQANPPSTFSSITNEFICIECVKMRADYEALKSHRKVGPPSPPKPPTPREQG